MPHYERILVTGAAGRLGLELRKSLSSLASKIRVAHRRPFTDLRPYEEEAVFDLSDKDATIAAVEGCDAIVHFGGASLESPWQTILDANIRGSYHIYEGARKNRVKRVVYASSVHAIGYHEVEAHIGVDAPVRPDSLYGVSKNFVESLSRLSTGTSSASSRYACAFSLRFPSRRIVGCYGLISLSPIAFVWSKRPSPHRGSGIRSRSVCQ